MGDGTERCVERFFFFLTLLSYGRYADSHGRIDFLTVFLFLTLGLMSKPMIVTTPFVLLLLDYWPLKRLPASLFNHKPFRVKSEVMHCIREKIPLFIPVIIISLITYWVQRVGGPFLPDTIHTLPVRLANALVSYIQYVYKMIWPVNLAFFYPHPGMPDWWKILAACLLILIISILCLCFYKNHAYLLVGWLWYLGTLVPVIGIIQVGSQAMADRYTYIPLIGLFIIIAWGVPDLAAKWPYKKAFFVITAVTCVLLCFLLSWNQTAYWRDSVALYRRALNVTNNNFVAHHNLGVALAKQQKYAEAIWHYLETIKISPTYFTAHYNLGLALAAQGRTAEAINKYNDALHLRPNDYRVYFSLGNAKITTGQFNEALNYYSMAIKINPTYAEAYNNMGVVLVKMGMLQEATTHFRKAISLKHDYADALANLKRVNESLKSKK